MKICIIFRGENEREYIGYINALNHINNWQKYIFSYLCIEHNYDIVFITYKSNILYELSEKLKPKEVIICEKENSTQVTNMSIVNNYVQSNKDIYDRFIVLRFDIIYKTPITTWKYWDTIGITVPGKDITWYKTKFCNDIFFIIDRQYITYFNDAINYMLSLDDLPCDQRLDDYKAIPHHIGQYFFYKKININYIYEVEDWICDIYHPHYIFVRDDPNSSYL